MIRVWRGKQIKVTEKTMQGGIRAQKQGIPTHREDLICFPRVALSLEKAIETQAETHKSIGMVPMINPTVAKKIRCVCFHSPWAATGSRLHEARTAARGKRQRFVTQMKRGKGFDPDPDRSLHTFKIVSIKNDQDTTTLIQYNTHNINVLSLWDVTESINLMCTWIEIHFHGNA